MVPLPCCKTFQRLFRRYFQIEPVVVGPGSRTGMPILHENPRGKSGPIASSTPSLPMNDFAGGCLVVDFGTATTFDVVTPKGEYLGGAIAPGIGISADALFHAAAKLPRVELARPRSVIGKTPSPACSRVWSTATLDSSMASSSECAPRWTFHSRSLRPADSAPMIAKDSRTIEECDEMLTLTGLRLIYEREQRRSSRV